MMPNVPNPGSAGVIMSNKNAHDCNDIAFMQAATYNEIFGLKTAHKCNYWRGKIIKISYGKRSVHRRVEISTEPGLLKDMVVLTYESIGELSYYDKYSGKVLRPIDQQVTISKGCRLIYWLKHPNPAARISYHLGMLSVLLAVVSIMLSLFL